MPAGELTPAVRAAADQVQAAWINAGPVPGYHIAAQFRLMQEWPTLFRALVDLSAAMDAAAQERRP